MYVDIVLLKNSFCISFDSLLEDLLLLQDMEVQHIAQLQFWAVVLDGW